MPFEFNDASVLDCIAKIVAEKDLKEYNILLVYPQILGKVCEIKNTGEYSVKEYRGNIAVQKAFFSGEQRDHPKIKELSVIMTEESPELIDIVTDMQYFSRFDYFESPRKLVFNKEHYEKGTSGLRENLRGYEIDLTKKSHVRYILDD